MAGAIVTAASNAHAGVTKYEIVWVSDAAGAVSGSTFTMKPGAIVQVEFVPGSGALAPTDLYDVDLLNAEGVSMFDNGAGTSVGGNLSATLASVAVPLIGLNTVSVFRRWHHGGNVQPLVANAGDSNAGTINIYTVSGVL